jgi:septal ring factor EnvC (AmiA/AmiB activator)
MSSGVNQEFANKLKNWAAYEKKSQELKAQINQLNEAKDQLTKELVSYIRMNNMQKTAINLPNNRICYYEEQQYNNLSFNFLKECLAIYFNNDQVKVEQLCNFIKSKRSKTIKPGLKFLPKKKT